MTPTYTPDRPSVIGAPTGRTAPASTPPPPAKASKPHALRFDPQYGAPTFTGEAAFVLIGAKRYGLPLGSQVAFPDDEAGGVVLVLVPASDGAPRLHMLTALGEVTNLTARAVAGLSDIWFGIDARPPT
ncbi:hypothetical protein [Microbacterium sp. T2.11-28]|uniref:hypothetical protein n=1 Tax=Microbacterium sp. T2.11-28 TaxID=3041169 RepID=UPI002477C946|nr:hypothetical protein [Microbacterium sp. T2.11-28]CAI9386530.1 hypothetical protein MICABA_00445 [Microbacterium sp. T2.11-28]